MTPPRSGVTRASWAIRAAVAVLAAASQGAAGQTRDRSPASGECRWTPVRVVRVDGAAAPYLQALRLSDRLRGATPLRHRPSRTLDVLRCPPAADPLESMRPGVLDRTLDAFASVQLVGNSAYPRGGNDGALWQGRGASGLLRAGVAARWWGLSAAVAPEAVFWQNARFDVRDLGGTDGQFRDPWHPLDLPTRPGDDAALTLLPGQSYLRVDLGPLAAGVSTANIRLGPGRVFPLLMGSAAPGFPHGFAGTGGPVRLGPVRVEVEAFGGGLRESEHYDDDPTNDRRALIGTYLALSPVPVPGLWVGVLRVYTEYLPEGRALEAVFRDNALDTPWVEGDDNNPGNGLASGMVSWAPPGTGFEVYGEYAREDYPYNLEDVAREPDWTRAYLLGASKLFEEGVLGTGLPVLVNAELANVSLSNPERAGKGWFSYYTHGRIRQGHTNRGQLLGAWIGPGSSAQRLTADVFTADGLVGGYLQRVAYDEDTYYRLWALRYGGVGHDVELTAAAHARRPALGGSLWAEVRVSHRWNRGFVVFGQEGATSGQWNLGLELQLLLGSS